MKLIYLAIISLLTNVGCAKQVSDWVHAAPDFLPSANVPTAGSLESQGKIGVKISPGSIQGVGTTVGVRAGLTQRQFQGTSQGIGIQVGVTRAPANF